MLTGDVLITGGAGSLGQAIVRRALSEGWDCSFTIYSRDPLKHQAMRREFPDCRYLIGDILDREALTRVAAGHDTIIHAAAQKHIPEAERQPDQCFAVNVRGTENVLAAALEAQVERVLVISTDKACHPVNAYGCSKLAAERIAQQFALRVGGLLSVNLCRYGNVLGSNGSVIPVWERQHLAGQPLTLTNPDMTRFWLTLDQAVDLIVKALEQPTGTVLIPQLPGLAMDDFATYLFPTADVEITGLRPGEKMHEELLTPEESVYAEDLGGHYRLWPVTGRPCSAGFPGYTSDQARQLSRGELLAMVAPQETKVMVG